MNGASSPLAISTDSPPPAVSLTRAEKNRLWSREYARRKRAENPSIFAERVRRWKKANPEKHRESVRKWKQEHPAKVRAGRKKYDQRHPEKKKERLMRYRQKNAASERSRAKQWYVNNPEKAKANARRGRQAREQREKEFLRATNFVSTLNNVQNLKDIKLMISEPAPAPVQLRSSDSVENLITLIGKAGEQLREAAGMLSRLVANDPATVAKIREQAPTIPAGLLTNLLRVGDRSLHPDLLLNNCLAYRKLRLLPYSTQEHLLAVGAVEMVVNAETGDTLRVPIIELTGQQTSQVLSSDGLRSRDDQRAWLKRRQMSAVCPAEPAAWFVKKDRLIITRACEMSKTQLLAAVAELCS